MNRASTNTSFTCAGDPSVGTVVNLTAAVKPASLVGEPTGAVAFTVDNAPGPSCSLAGDGLATCSPLALSSGSHQIAASYGGDGNFAPSQAPSQTCPMQPAYLPMLER